MMQTKFQAQLLEFAAQDHRVIGLVWAGSAAERSRLDEWSDVDFFLVVHEEFAESMRNHLDWLPAAETIAIAARETEHGLKVVYPNALVLEFAVFTRSEIQLAKLNAHELALDKAELSADVANIVISNRVDELDLDRELGLLFGTLVIALGRARRGETLIAGRMIKTAASDSLIRCVHSKLQSKNPTTRDNLEPWRRFEIEFPEVADKLALIHTLEPEAAGIAIAELATQLFTEYSQVPQRSLTILRNRFTPQ